MSTRHKRNLRNLMRRFLSGIVLWTFLCSQAAYPMPLASKTSTLSPPSNFQGEEGQDFERIAKEALGEAASQRSHSGGNGKVVSLSRAGRPGLAGPETDVDRRIRAWEKTLQERFDDFDRTGDLSLDGVLAAAHKARVTERIFQDASAKGDEESIGLALTLSIQSIHQNPLVKLLDKVGVGDRILSFRIGSGLNKKYNDKYLNPFRNDQLIAKRQGVLRKLLEDARLIDRSDFLYRTSTGDAFVLKKTRFEGLVDPATGRFREGPHQGRTLEEILAGITQQAEQEVEAYLLDEILKGDAEGRKQTQIHARFKLAFGLSGLVESEGEDAIARADSQSLRAAMMGFFPKEDRRGRGQIYNEEKLREFVSDTERLRVDLTKAAPRLFDEEGELHDWVVEKLRKGEEVPGISEVLKSKLRTYFERENVFDYLKPWGVDREGNLPLVHDLDLLLNRLGDLRTQILKQEDPKRRGEFLAAAPDLLSKAWRDLAKSHRNRIFSSDTVFHNRGIKADRAVYIAFDVLGVGVRNYRSFVKARKDVLRGRPVEEVAADAGADVDKILKDIHEIIKTVYQRQLEEAVVNKRISKTEHDEFMSQEIVAMVGGDEVFMLADPRVATTDFLTAVQDTVRIRAIRTAIVELDQSVKPGREKIKVHAQAVVDLGKGLEWAKKLEGYDIYRTVVSKIDVGDGRGPRWVALFREEDGSARIIDIEDGMHNEFAFVPASYFAGRSSGRRPEGLEKAMGDFGEAELLEHVFDPSLVGDLRERALRILLERASKDEAVGDKILSEILSRGQGSSAQDGDPALLRLLNRIVASLFDPARGEALGPSAVRQRRMLAGFLERHSEARKIFSWATREIAIQLNFLFKNFFKLKLDPAAERYGLTADSSAWVRERGDAVRAGLTWLGQAAYGRQADLILARLAMTLFARYGDSQEAALVEKYENRLQIEGLREGGVVLGDRFLESARRLSEVMKKKLGMDRGAADAVLNVVEEAFQETNVVRKTLFALFDRKVANQEIKDIEISFIEAGAQKKAYLVTVTMEGENGEEKRRFALKQMPFSNDGIQKARAEMRRQIEVRSVQQKGVPEHGWLYTNAERGLVGTVVEYGEYVFLTEEFIAREAGGGEIAMLHSDHVWKARANEAPRDRLERLREAGRNAARALIADAMRAYYRWTIQDPNPGNFLAQGIDGKEEEEVLVDFGEAVPLQDSVDLIRTLILLKGYFNTIKSGRNGILGDLTASKVSEELREAGALKKGEDILRLEDLFEGVLRADSIKGLDLLIHFDEDPAGRLKDLKLKGVKQEEVKEAIRRVLAGLADTEEGVRLLEGYNEHVRDLAHNSPEGSKETAHKITHLRQLLELLGDVEGGQRENGRDRVLQDRFKELLIHSHGWLDNYLANGKGGKMIPKTAEPPARKVEDTLSIPKPLEPEPVSAMVGLGA